MLRMKSDTKCSTLMNYLNIPYHLYFHQSKQLYYKTNSIQRLETSNINRQPFGQIDKIDRYTNRR